MWEGRGMTRPRENTDNSEGVVVITGYHGTSSRFVEAILSEGFRSSRNEYDWLGDGVYFFQDAPDRAQEWAQCLYGEDAVVMMAEVNLKDCMDLLDIRWSSFLAEAYDQFLGHARQAEMSLPRQTSGAHRLDRAVINYAVGVLRRQRIMIRSVRAAFSEGRPVFPNSAIYDRSHVQIAIRDVSVIHSVQVL